MPHCSKGGDPEWVWCCWTRDSLIFNLHALEPCLLEKKKHANNEFSILHAKLCVQITGFHDCHSVPSVSAKMGFSIPCCRFYSLKSKTFSKYFDFSTTKQNYISLLTLMELGRDPRIYWCLAFCRCLWKIWSAVLIKNSYFPYEVIREKDLNFIIVTLLKLEEKVREKS